MAQTRGGISAKQIQRETGVTYKCAWRMCKEIRSMLFEDNNDKLDGQVELESRILVARKPVVVVVEPMEKRLSLE
jgi:hypothetical protein